MNYVLFQTLKKNQVFKWQKSILWFIKVFIYRMISTNFLPVKTLQLVAPVPQTLLKNRHFFMENWPARPEISGRQGWKFGRLIFLPWWYIFFCMHVHSKSWVFDGLSYSRYSVLLKVFRFFLGIFYYVSICQEILYPSSRISGRISGIRPAGYPARYPSSEAGYPAGYRIPKKAGYPAGRISGATLVLRTN